MEKNIEELKNNLTQHVCRVSFVKKGGSERKMVCTLNKDIIPQKFLSNGTETNFSDLSIVTEKKVRKNKNPEIISVYDLEKSEWRSFDIKTMFELEVFGQTGDNTWKK